jgi:hypothetical protein
MVYNRRFRQTWIGQQQDGDPAIPANLDRRFDMISNFMDLPHRVIISTFVNN